MKTNYKIVIGVVALIVILWVALGYKLIDLKKKEKFYGFHVGKQITDHTLTSQDGRKLSFSDLRGDIILVNFGYTSCPDVCPTTLAKLRMIYEQLGSKKDRVDVLFITIDPERDTKEKLAKFVPYFDKDFIGLTGSTDEIKKVADDFNVNYFKEAVKSDTDYLMSHTSSVFLVNAGGEILLKYPQQMLDPEKVAGDIEMLL